jgi:APA family basic amino acid/polyamine antiporter
MVPVLFAYGGWQTSTFVAGEIREPQRTFPRVDNWGDRCGDSLSRGEFRLSSSAGVSGLANTTTPAPT